MQNPNSGTNEQEERPAIDYYKLAEYYRKKKRRRERRRFIVHICLAGALGSILAVAGLTARTWGFWAIIAISAGVYINARL